MKILILKTLDHAGIYLEVLKKISNQFFVFTVARFYV